MFSLLWAQSTCCELHGYMAIFEAVTNKCVCITKGENSRSCASYGICCVHFGNHDIVFAVRHGTRTPMDSVRNWLALRKAHSRNVCEVSIMSNSREIDHMEKRTNMCVCIASTKMSRSYVFNPKDINFENIDRYFTPIQNVL